ncbi:MAG: hypothetical protein IPG50_13800 [Myxococcales bacterium]|nr:hypothetical protein [Myxococcales bacterium]
MFDCGSCLAPQSCGGGTVANQCGCSPATTCPAGQNCGSADDGCGGTIDCGSCTAPQSCSGGATANQCGCTPATTCPAGQNCGTADDGCGGTVDCGACTGPQSCGGGGTGNQCGCTPATACPSGQNCGSADDGCGGLIDCGSCGAPQSCGGGGIPNQCGCTPGTVCPAGENCGTASDGCGGTITCGTCTEPETCAGAGVPNHCGCTPKTTCPANFMCGTAPDDCGGQVACGSCTTGESCNDDHRCTKTTFAFRDAAGRLIGEYDATGAPIYQVAYMGQTPVARFTPTESQTIHTDHLGTPRALADATDKIVWKWDGDAFGMSMPDEDPDGDSVKLSFPMRFPGQLYDDESGLHYNVFRDYDPKTGRYLQADPIGLAGGASLYGYVGGAPVGRSDPTGLYWFLPYLIPYVATAATTGVALLYRSAPMLNQATILASEVVVDGGGMGFGAMLTSVGRSANRVALAARLRNVNSVRGTTNCQEVALSVHSILRGHGPRPVTNSAAGAPEVLEKALGGKFTSRSPIEEIIKQMEDAGPGAAGIVSGSNPFIDPTKGHVFNVINDGGIVRFIDAQPGGNAFTAGSRAAHEEYSAFRLLLPGK